MRLVADAVGLSGTGDDGLALAEVLFLLAHREVARAPHDVVDLVRTLVGVELLGLAGEEAVGILEEMR